MQNYRSKITYMISKVRDRSLDFFTGVTAQTLNQFIEDKLARQGKTLSYDEDMEISKKIEAVDNARELIQFDIAISDFEQAINRILSFKPGELEFTIAKELQMMSEDLKEQFREVFSDDKKEGKVLPFTPEKRRH